MLAIPTHLVSTPHTLQYMSLLIILIDLKYPDYIHTEKNPSVLISEPPTIAGMPIKNANSAPQVRENPIKIAPRIVAPERDVPGIIASIWKTPIRNAYLYEI